MTVSISGTGGVTFPDNSVQTTAATGFGFKNRIINGAMVIDQRNAGAAQNSLGGSASIYLVDRWQYYGSQASKFNSQQNAASVTPPAGYANYLGLTSTSAYSVTSTDFFQIAQPIEGFNTADLNWGTANAQPITLSFWVRSSLTGTFGGTLNGGQFYPFSYSIPVANTWTQISVTVLGSTSGSWGSGNSSGMNVVFSLGVGSSVAGTAGAWTNSLARGATGQTNIVGTSGATFYITGVQLEKGSTATAFDVRPYGTELALCQRYYAKLNATYSNFAAFGSGMVVSTTLAEFYVKYPVQMRGAATVTQSNTKINAGLAGPATSSIAAVYAGTDSCYLSLNASGMTVGYGAVLVANNNASAYIDLSSEL